MYNSNSGFGFGLGFFKGLIILVFIMVIGALVFKVALISRAVSSGKPLYEISVSRYDQVEEYLTSEYNVDPQTKCITFKDELGIKRTVCNNYTITQY
jgi:hypothetical protein